jgi:hypothetical protein
MKFITAVQFSAFAESAAKSAGLDIDAAFKAGNADFIKAAIDAAKSPAADSVKAEALLGEAVEENKKLAADLAAAKSALATAETNLSAAKTEAAKQEEKIAKSAAALVAKSGHSPIADEIVGNQSATNGEKAKAKSATDSTVTGADRMRADFHRQISAMWNSEHRRN